MDILNQYIYALLLAHCSLRNILALIGELVRWRHILTLCLVQCVGYTVQLRYSGDVVEVLAAISLGVEYVLISSEGRVLSRVHCQGYQKFYELII